MKYLLLAVSMLALAGCSTTVPVTMTFPDVPEELSKPCPPLGKVPDNTKELSTTLEVVVKNYSKYHQCSSKVDAWNEWYNTQKKIYESVK